MDESEKDRIRHEIEDELNTRFPGVVRRIYFVEHDEDSQIPPGEVLLRVVVARGAYKHPKPRATEGPGNRITAPPEDEPPIMTFIRELARRGSAIRRYDVLDEDAEQRQRARFPRVADDPAEKADDSLTPVMVRLKPPELEVVDTLIKAGIAPNRAEAVRWALARIVERPAYQQVREHTSKIEDLKKQF